MPVKNVVPGAGIEPAHLSVGDFESPASTNFTTRAHPEGSPKLWHSGNMNCPHAHHFVYSLPPEGALNVLWAAMRTLP